uniref:SGNH hydrolase-type esterase domain-containing protein n=1 Tax=Tanacetum cinerariifolium TaxID=118510 RepID=A0A6L2NQV9_TANCI|nr:SGNH hydrolase-type esterase domain-containing protein [Tanacetum cinerariifolium]
MFHNNILVVMNAGLLMMLTNLPICYDDDDDEERSDFLNDNIISGLPSFSAITPDEPVLSTEELDNSLSMGDEHLDTISATESDEFIKSGVETLIPIPSESEGIPEHMCDVPSQDNSLPLDVSKDQIEDFSESNKEFSLIDDDSFSIDNIDYVKENPKKDKIRSKPDKNGKLDRINEIIIKEYLAMKDKKMAKQIMDSSLGKLWYLADEDDERLSSIEDDLFAYELGVLEDSYIPSIEQPYDKLKHDDLNIYEPQQCYDEYKRMFAEAVIPIDNRLVKLIDITFEQWLDLKFSDHKKVDKEIMERVVATWLIQSYKKQFKEYMKIKRRLEVNGINIDVECDPTNVEFSKWLASKFNNHKIMDWYIKNELWLYWKSDDDEEVLTYDEFFDFKEENLLEDNEITKIFRIEANIFEFETPDEALKKLYWMDHGDMRIGKERTFALGINNGNDAIHANQEWFDDHKLMKDDDDDDIEDLDDYLISQDAPYYVDEEEEGFKERKSKLLRIPYEKPPTFNFESSRS